MIPAALGLIQQVGVALNIAVDQPRAARPADAGPAHGRHVQAGILAGLEQRAAGTRRDRPAGAHQAQLEGLAGRTFVRRRRFRRLGVLARYRDREVEGLGTDLRFRYSELDQGRREAADHRRGTAQHEDVVLEVLHLLGQHARVDAARQIGAVVGTAGGGDPDLDPWMAAGDPSQLVPIGHVGLGVDRVQQRHRPRRLGVDRVAEHAHHRCDPDAAGQQRHRTLITPRVDEAAGRTHHLEQRSRTRGRMQGAGHQPLALDRDLEISARLGRRRDRVAARHRSAVHADPDGDELAGPKLESCGARESEGPDVGGLLEHRQHRRLDEPGRRLR